MIKTLIIEDEEPAAIRLGKMLTETDPEITVLDTLDSIESSVNWMQNNPQPDLIMLDIQLSDGLSFEIFRQVNVESFVIFTTAYDEYAIRAFELNSVDYLLKPIDREKLGNSLQKFKKLSASSTPPININELLESLNARAKSYKKRFAVNIGAKIVSVEVGQIAFFYSLEKSTFICTRENHHYLVDFSLEAIEGLVDPDQFFRISRQHIIHFSAIEKIHILSKSRIKIESNPPCEETLLVSTAKAHAFRLWLDR
jgi:DNA-binding LytR/AlgR family response regulator